MKSDRYRNQPSSRRAWAEGRAVTLGGKGRGGSRERKKGRAPEGIEESTEARGRRTLIGRDELPTAVAANLRHTNRAPVVEPPDLIAVAASAVRTRTVVTVTVDAIAVPVAFPFTNIHIASFFFQFSAFRFHLWNVRQQVHNP